MKLKIAAALLSLATLPALALTTQNDKIVDSQGRTVELKGVNWFGFNKVPQDPTPTTMVDGLWNPGAPMSADFATVVQRMKALGFNAVRLPFSFKNLNGSYIKNYTYNNCQIPDQAAIQKSVTNEGVTVPPGQTIPPLPAPPRQVPNQCNSDLPNDSVAKRYAWTVNFFVQNGFYVLIDNHLREDQTLLEEGTGKWADKWATLLTYINKQYPGIQDKLMIDLLNEPDNFGLKWKASGGQPGLGDAYLTAMDKLYPIMPGALFFIEGTGQSGINANWGDGFVTDPADIAKYGLSDPNDFFTALLKKNYVNQVVISPHVYPPSVTNANSDYEGQGLYNRLNKSFGYLTTKGYCPKDGSACHQFPIAIGEFGSKFEESKDSGFLRDFASYMNNNNDAKDAKHNPMPNWFYWSWNPNSGDTGGLVADNWVDIRWNKIAYLSTGLTGVNTGNGFGLKPWYQTPVELGKVCLQVASTQDGGLKISDLMPIQVGSTVFNIKQFNTPVCNDAVTVGSYPVSAPDLSTQYAIYKAAPQSVTVNKGQQSNVTVQYKSYAIEYGSACVTVKQVNGLNFNDVKPIHVGDQDITVSAFDVPACKNFLPGSYLASAPTLQTPAGTFKASSKQLEVVAKQKANYDVVYAAEQAGGCTVAVQTNSPWEDPWGSKRYKNSVNVYVSNGSKQVINAPWSLVLTTQSYTGIVDMWSAKLDSIANGRVATTFSESWGALQPNNGNEINFGFTAAANSPNFMPTGATLNGVTCTVKTK